MTVPAGLDHVAFFYRNRADYLAGIGWFVADGLARDSAVTVAVPGPRLAWLRSGLPAELTRQVAWADMAVDGRNPGRIMYQVLLAAVRRNPGRRSYLVGEPIWPGRTELEYPACAAHEALINQALAGEDATVLCPYDTVALAQHVVADARRTHPVLRRDGRSWHSPEYDPDAVARFNRPLPALPRHAAITAFSTVDDLVGVRGFTTRHASAAGLSPGRVGEAMVAVNELTTNTLEHTPAGGTVAAWTEPEVLVFQVNDAGHLTQPLVGRLPPSGLRERGRGLFLVNMICDLVRVHTAPSGTAIRVHFAR